MITFVLTSVAVMLPGILTPGPMMAASLAAGTRHRHAGALIAVGHGLVEFPLIALLVAGAGRFLESGGVKTWVGVAGGVFLILLGVQLLSSLRRAEQGHDASAQRHPLWTGVVLTAVNPYFLVWWATVGLTLTGQAMEYGLVALALFAVIHWLCDLGWFEALSLAGFQGSQLLGGRSQQVVSAVCAVLLLGFGVKFIYDALGRISGTG